MQEKFRDRFDPKAWAEIYESSSPDATQQGFHRGTEIVRAECLSRCNTGEYWLDAGCGTGHLTNDLTAAGLKVVGFDHDHSMITAAKQRFPQLNFLQAAAAQFPFPSECFNGVIGVSVMGCFDSPESFYKETHRVLRRNGIVILTCTNRSSLLLRINARLKPKSGDSFHLYVFSEVRQDLRSNGFELMDFGFYNFFLNPGKNPIPSFRVAKFLERFGKFPGTRFAGRNFVVVAKRL